MKHAKKMIMVPEAEYLALLSMINSADPLVREKANLEVQMADLLKSPQISADLKMKKHDALYKQRRHLQNKIENKPQKVVIENAESLHPPSVPPYLDTGTHSVSKNVSHNIQSTPIRDSGLNTSASDVSPITEKKIQRRRTGVDVRPYINPNYIDGLIKYIDQNPTKFKIMSGKKMKVSAKRKEGNFEDIVKYMALGPTNVKKPNGFGTLYNILKDDPYFITLYNKSDQEGFGRKILPLTSKVKGLKRIKKHQFIPTIWSKL